MNKLLSRHNPSHYKSSLTVLLNHLYRNTKNNISLNRNIPLVAYSTLFTAMSTTAPATPLPELHKLQQPSGHTVFPLHEWPVSLQSYYCYAIATLDDSANYCYAIVDIDTGASALIDPAEPDVVLSTFTRIIDYHQSQYNIKPYVTHILTTHKHWYVVFLYHICIIHQPVA